MQRTTSHIPRIPDAINCSPLSQFTTIPTKVLRNSSLSLKAKGLLAILLSNAKGWQTHITTIASMNKDGIDAIRSGLQELEFTGYFISIKYRSKLTKQWAGSFWAYTNTPNQWEIEEQLQMIDTQGYEPDPKNPVVVKARTGLARPGKAKLGFPQPGNPMVSNINIKKNNKKNNNKDKNNIFHDDVKITPTLFTTFWEAYPKTAGKGEALSTWNTMCNKLSHERPYINTLLKAITAQQKTSRWQYKDSEGKNRYIPNAKTWLNQSRWLDDPKEMVYFDSNSTKATDTRSTGYVHEYTKPTEEM